MTETYWSFIRAAALGTLLSAAPAISQYAPVDPMPLGQTSTSTMANKISGDIASGRSKSNKGSGRCYDDSGPGAERRAMEAEYTKRLRTTGKAGADTWRAAHGRAYRADLIRSGKCPASALDGRRP